MKQNNLKEKIYRYAHSIKVQMVLSFMVILFFAIILCTVVNSAFLEKYYIYVKEDKLVSSYEKVVRIVSNGDISDSEYDDDVDEICTSGNLSMLVVSSSMNVIRTSAANTKSLIGQFTYTLKAYYANGQSDKEYFVAKIKDANSGVEYLILFSTISEDTYLFLSSPIQSIRESVQLSNKFLKYTCLVALILSGILIIIISRKITTPILEITEISKRMTKLDFEAKYTSGGKNEISILGENINKLSETLETTISELKTANNELERDIEKKEKIDSMRKEFLSNVSHELKTPIALIQGYAEGLKECVNNDDESKDFYCDVIMDEAGKMNNMVRKLLTLNQLEFGNDVVSMERFDIIELIKGVIMSTEILRRDNGIELIFNEKEPIYVWADEFKTEEVVTNFLSNAINHAKYQKVIEIKAIVKEDGVRISVFNTGDNIPKEDLDRIWDKFYKVDKARTREYGGSGIGLSIVKAIMDSFHKDFGVINYENGVEFYFELDCSV
ncbi:HAMP domain-containing sensor histidine kinase [Acetitomaculum ruminis]|nr:ATP-binding protein [Acetitomaculum ruminis]